MASALVNKMIWWTLGLVLGLGTVCFNTLLKPPSTRLKVTVSGQELLREPASNSSPEKANSITAIAATTLDKNSLAVALELEIPCAGELKSSFSPQVRLVRLLGNQCRNKKQITNLQIENRTNHFSATTFFLNETAFTSDYISLAPGENHLTLNYQYADGSNEIRDFDIKRIQEPSTP